MSKPVKSMIVKEYRKRFSGVEGAVLVDGGVHVDGPFRDHQQQHHGERHRQAAGSSGAVTQQPGETDAGGDGEPGHANRLIPSAVQHQVHHRCEDHEPRGALRRTRA